LKEIPAKGDYKRRTGRELSEEGREGGKKKDGIVRNKNIEQGRDGCLSEEGRGRGERGRDRERRRKYVHQIHARAVAIAERSQTVD
jgi:hypothetical protein